MSRISTSKNDGANAMTDDTTIDETTDETTDRTPRNLQRAAKLRTKASQFKADFILLDRWLKQDTAEAHVAKLKAALEAAQLAIENAATLYEELPASVMKIRAGGGGGKSGGIEEGMFVKVKEKYVETYLAISNGEPVDHLKVITRRDTHVLVETSGGERLFVAAKELEPVEDA